MRFEGRHLYFKKLASNLGNFKNIALSLAVRYQQLQCYVSMNDSVILGESSLEYGRCSVPEIPPNLEHHFQVTSISEIKRLMPALYLYMG